MARTSLPFLCVFPQHLHGLLTRIDLFSTAHVSVFCLIVPPPARCPLAHCAWSALCSCELFATWSSYIIAPPRTGGHLKCYRVSSVENATNGLVNAP